jgi:hypothetical protein
MGNRFASGRFSIAECDRCGQRYKLTELKKLVIKTKQVTIKVCQTCWEPDQPQLQLGMYPVDDPQAVREPRRDNSYIQSGYTGLQTLANASPVLLSDGTPAGGSRIIQWGWAPVGGARADDAGLTPNYLVAQTTVANVTIN